MYAEKCTFFYLCDKIKIEVKIMGLLKDISDFNKRRKQRKEERSQKVNQNPTEEQLKDNKNGKKAYLWSFLSVIAYLIGFVVIASGFNNNFAIGIIAMMFVLPITSLIQRKAIGFAQQQRKINGKGLFALIVASVVPLIVLFVGFMYFAFGWMYKL